MLNHRTCRRQASGAVVRFGALLAVSLIATACQQPYDSYYGSGSGSSAAMSPDGRPEASPGPSGDLVQTRPLGLDNGAVFTGIMADSYDARPVTPGAPTGTFVGNKVIQLRGDLDALQRSIATHNDQLQQIRAETTRNTEMYHGTIGTINARLQIGTTPGNPILSRQWGDAQLILNRVADNVAQLSELANRVSTDSALGSFLLESTQAAYSLSGAVEEDHRQLAILEDEVNRTVVLVDRLLSEINGDVERQSDYVSRERRDLQTLALAIKNGERYGDNLHNRPLFSGGSGRSGARPSGNEFASAMPGGAPALANPYGPPSDRPLVVIRFDQPDVAFEQPLYGAISEALDRRPNAVFEVVAVSPGGRKALSGASARRHAEKVSQTLREMGVPADRLQQSERTSTSTDIDEVHVFVR